MDAIISIITFTGVGYVLGSIGYGVNTWQFWIIISCMFINRLSALFHN